MVQEEHEVEFQHALVSIRETIRSLEGPDIKESLQEQIRQWFIECHDATGKFPDYPDEEDGGSAAVFAEKTPEQVTILLIILTDFKAISTSSNGDSICTSSSRAGGQRGGEEEEKQRKGKKEKKSGKKEKKKDKKGKGKRAKLSFQKKKKKGKKGGKKKQKKEKDLTADRTIESLYEELFQEGLLIRPSRTKLTDFIGEYIYLGTTLLQADIEPMPSLSEVKQLMALYGILPLGSQEVHEKPPLMKTLLLAGLAGVGKKMLVHALCTETGANLFNLSSANIAGKYPGKSGLQMMVARQLQPSVVWIGDAEKTYKKAEKEMEPKCLKKDLQKLLKSIKAEDRVLIVGTTRRTFDADLKPFCKVYKKILLIPRPDYSSRLVLWSDVILQNRGLDLSSLAKTTDGYTRGHMVRAVLTDRRVQLQDKKPLSAVEFISPLARQDPIYKEEEEEAFETGLQNEAMLSTRASVASSGSPAAWRNSSDTQNNLKSKSACLLTRVTEQDSRAVRKPLMTFSCPDVLKTLLSQHWKDLQEGFSDSEELNKEIEFQSDELQWTATKRDCLRYLLEHGARPNLAPGGKTALHEACENSNTDCAVLLLQHGANPNLLNEDGLAPLHLCKTSQSFRCAKVLLRHGAVVGQPSEEECETPLHVAAKHGLNNHLHLYLRNGAAVDCTDRSGETPLGAACAGAKSPEELENYLKVCRLLLLYGAEANAVDKENRSPLHKACRNAQHSLVMLLLENKADINAIDYNGGSPLSNVLQNSNLKLDLQPHLTVQTLLNHGALKVWPLAFLKIHQSFYESLFSLEGKPRCLQHMCRSAIRKQCGHKCHVIITQLPLPKCAKVLLRHGAVVDQPSEEECETPLHVAAKHGLNNHLHLYLRNGAAVDCTDRSGETPLGAACAGAKSPEELENYLKVCRLLLLYGAEANAVDKENRSPLHKACRNAQHSLVMLLLENKADINAIDYNGGSPLSNVLQNSNLKLDLQPHLTVQTLLNHGALKVWPLAFLKIHQSFYESLFSLEGKPRCLQHMCRSAIRKQCGHKCHVIITQLPLPKFLQRYLLLETEGMLY
ncbi:IQ and AAA domain-containing protein 1 [Acipenser ruthenus]|uniref:IQ and AAA domain-containing protein 1 n=1 Tax=Acipenser ruthenus TaxID=7906 RepID=A0A444U4E0_ACIRT|nr:IQ and AAA domain-containing protein 1 [Acipenser ruthenus]